MGKIKILPDNIINLIAAGEVVERPSSVVKELMENSIDADASKIILQVDEGGTKRISLTDNVSGMEPADAMLAFTQHATSKILEEKDLGQIATLGFRGEALASIGSVSNVTLETKGNSEEAIQINVAKSTISTGPSSKTVHVTSITVSELFGHIPARKKFLRSPNTEF